MNFHVISHTHWDREWHQTYQQYRVNLIRFMDELIELLETSPAYSSFLLDGQTIVLEDYLEIKPKNRDRIRKLVEEGRIIIGPWYIQPDEFMPSGESLVRNLLIGQQVGNEFGPSMQIGYLPDSFGQAAQIPQVLKGFGIDHALFWRGITNEETEKTDFWWVGPDGSKVLTTHLPLGYGNGRMLSTDLEQNVKIIEENHSSLKDMTTTPNMLLMCGFDQRSANKDLPEIMDELNKYYAEHGSEFQVRLSRLQDYFEGISQESEKLEHLSGEFRKGKNMRVHVSIASTRLDLKKKNFEVQNLYEKYVEPVNSLSFLAGHHYDNDVINKGWKYMMQNHAHDSICNVCTDDTHHEMNMRYEFAKQIGESVQKTATSELLGNIKFDENKGMPIVVVNTLGQKRKNIAEATLHVTFKEFILVDSNGNEVHYQVVETKEENLNDKQIEIGVKNADQFVFTTKIKFAAEVDGFGFSTYYVKEQAPMAHTFADVYQNGAFENEFIAVNIEKNGSLTIKEQKTGAIFKGLNVFEEGGNAGDEYDFSPPREDVIITTRDAAPEISVVHNGPIFATVKIAYQMEFPVDTDVNSRSKEKKASTIETYVMVNRYEDRVDVKTVIDNTVKNHRIRALFDTGMTTKTHIADQPFGTIRRDNYLEQVEYWEQENWEEKYYPIYPQQKFVDVSDDQKGISILNKGLPQYEILNGEKPTIALTLLAGTDYMGKQDLVDRPGRRSGLHVATPDSLLLGKHEMEYSIIAHQGNEIKAGTGVKASEFTTPFMTVPLSVKRERGSLSDNCTFIRVEGTEVAISAVKKCENDNSLLVRIYNTTNQPIDSAKLEINQELFKTIKLVNLNEVPITEQDERILFTANEIHLKDIRPNEVLSFTLS
ncbi:glycoside hydrolase family 38 C-terminal domain-containing protein [Bacillus sp. AFS037270]|uniref:glycoside hydrolase family 38 N-terminal domain-containing protein n=1 Tax=Bacillus sp. AFS037270 TaxID=2033499 RepID=UPI000BFB4785|nr:glycoside hydrolase family 38 C-terminal domain-containing protein [Bacillus sp. AFS037270]PGV53466.1 alpha-mannosidase [Bacillus sp. AFS037270]